MKSLARTLVLLIVAAATPAGCGGADDEPTTTRTQQTTTTTEQDGGPPPVGDGEGGVALTMLAQLDEPLYLTQPPGESRDLYVVERGGAIRILRGGEVRPQPFLDIGDLITTAGSEQGLLSMAFAPDYQSSGLFYVDYTDTEGDTRVVEYRRSQDDPSRADPGSARELLRVDQPYENHNGGLVLFGPDRNLYIGLGDGGSGGDPERRGQDLSTLLGKILRIDPRPQGGRPYRIPEGNPFAGRPGARPEIFIYGARNPWRFSFDPRNRALLVADVGQDEFEEVDYLPRSEQAGANLGWSAFEGNARFNQDQQAPGHVPPILTYGREGGCSITGGYVVRDRRLRSLFGRYVYGDYCLGELHSFIPSRRRARDDLPLGESVSGLSSFGTDNAGRVYAVSLEGPVYRLDPSG